MSLHDSIGDYLSHGKNLTVLKDRVPIKKDWAQLELTEHQLRSHKGNLGWVIGPGDLVVDIDPRNGGEEGFARLIEFLELDDPLIELTPTVMTPRGGRHYYMKMPDSFIGQRFKKGLKEYPGVDFLTQGAQCVIPGSIVEQGEYTWADDLIGSFEQHEAPNALLALIAQGSTTQASSDLDDLDALIGGSTWPEEKVLAMLDRLDSSMGNDEWVKVGMALHDWDPLLGLQLWEDWSKDGDNYNEGETEKRWRSFDIGGGVTLGTVSYMVKEVNYDDQAAEIGQYLNKIKYADEKGLEFELAPKIKKLQLSDLNREKLVKAFQDRYKEVSGVKMPVGSVRMLLSSQEILSGHFVRDDEAPDWCKRWVYVNSHTGFLDINTMGVHKAESFNVENGQFVPMGEGGAKPSASKYIADRGFVRKVDAIAYLPTYEGMFCTIEGSKVVNSFNPKTVPEEATEFTEDGLAAIDKVKKHIDFVCNGNKEYAEILLQWLVHQVQYPGRQVLWSPVIQSIEGLGKSFFGELMRACLGDRNVGVVSPSQATSEFNEWATGVVVNVLEELKVQGHNRYDAVNAIKPLITDRIIQINDKGVRPYRTYNTANYICFTNHRDALPLREDDRRWWVIFHPIEKLSDLPKFVGKSVEDYFPELFDAVRGNGSEIRKWFLEYEISAEFLRIKQAPMTDSKLSMIATEEASFEGLAEARELLATGGKYFNTECISSADFFEALFFEHPDLEINTSRRNLILKRLGYSLEPSKVKIDGKSRKIWSKRKMDNTQVRQSLMKWGKNKAKI